MLRAGVSLLILGHEPAGGGVDRPAHRRRIGQDLLLLVSAEEDDHGRMSWGDGSSWASGGSRVRGDGTDGRERCRRRFARSLTVAARARALARRRDAQVPVLNESPSRVPALCVHPRAGRRRAVHLQRLRIRRRLPGSPRRSRLGLERPNSDGDVTRAGPVLALCLQTRTKNDGTLRVGPRTQRCPDMLRAVDVSPLRYRKFSFATARCTLL